MTRLVSCVAIVAACLIGACASSPPMRYYTLTQIAPETRLSVPADTVPLRLDRVNLPSELDRLQLVRKIDATRLQISEVDRWAAPLDEMIKRVLSVDLAARLPANLVADPNEPSQGERRQSLSVDIQEFYADAGCSITLHATWIVKQPQPASAPGGRQGHGATAQNAQAQNAQASEEIQMPAAASCSGSAPLPEAMSRALAVLSDRIAAAVAKSASPGG